jgi:repressor LexA
MYLTKRQDEMLKFIEQFIAEKRYSPSLEEIGAGIGLSSIATVHVHLRNLEKKKLIRRFWNHSRSIELTDRGRVRSSVTELPLLGRVAAGSPIEAVETPETIEVPEDFLRGKENFVLRVQGESMINEQIRDGDLIIVERRETADNGDTVVALINGADVTVKKFYREGRDQIRLQPANDTMKPIIVPAKTCAVQGVVIGLLRKY